MSTLNLIVFAVVFFITYLVGVFTDRYMKKKWIFKVSLSFLLIALLLGTFSLRASDKIADDYVNLNVAHEWKERIVSVQEVEDVVRSRENEGFLVLGCGWLSERETFRYTIVKKDGVRLREKLYTHNCSILKAEKQKQIQFIQRVRVYKNSDDEKFFKNAFDHSEGSYRAYVL